MIKFQPTFNNVMVAIPEIKEKTDSGIIKGTAVQEAEKHKTLQLEVLAVGDKVTSVKVGDIIILNPNVVKHAGVDIEIEDKGYCVFHENCILGYVL